MGREKAEKKRVCIILLRNFAVKGKWDNCCGMVKMGDVTARLHAAGNDPVERGGETTQERERLTATAELERRGGCTTRGQTQKGALLIHHRHCGGTEASCLLMTPVFSVK